MSEQQSIFIFVSIDHVIENPTGVLFDSVQRLSYSAMENMSDEQIEKIEQLSIEDLVDLFQLKIYNPFNDASSEILKDAHNPLFEKMKALHDERLVEFRCTVPNP